jgi:dTDP-4-dehydrorhamnose 3,5-epimerase
MGIEKEFYSPYSELEINSFLDDSSEGCISDLLFLPKKIISDLRGSVMHGLRSDSEEFKGFGEVYFSTVKAGLWKEWKRHLESWQSLIVVNGAVSFLMKDDRPLSASYKKYQKVLCSESKLGLLQIPPKVWYCFYGEGESKNENLIVSISSLAHNPAEIERWTQVNK